MGDVEQRLRRMKVGTDLVTSEVHEAANHIAAVEAENDALRRALATSNADCPYCGLKANEMAKCAHGFPGCARADDMNC
jgi:hypothetical protein